MKRTTWLVLLTFGIASLLYAQLSNGVTVGLAVQVNNPVTAVLSLAGGVCLDVAFGYAFYKSVMTWWRGKSTWSIE